MPKINRGNTYKLNIRLSIPARQNIENQAKNLGVSAAGIILFELAKIFQNPPSKSDINQLADEISLERDHFVLTINDRVKQNVEDLSQAYDMRKNVLIGLLVSSRFQDSGEERTEEDLEPKKLMVQVNSELKKKMMKYSEENFIPLSALVSYSILQGPSENLPQYEDQEIETFFTNVPSYIGDLVKDEAAAFNIREHFYTSLCLYKQFGDRSGRFIR